MWKLIKEEPVSVQGVVQAVIALGTSFGLGWNGNQVGGVLAVTAAILTLVTRQQVTPIANPKTTVSTPLVTK